jgi:mRNA interferase YafQ
MADKSRLSIKDFFVSLSNFDDEALYIVDYTTEFKKNIKLSYKRKLDLNLLKTIIQILAKEGVLPKEYRPHPLKGYKKKQDEEIMECHIQPDWLLVWKQNDTELTLLLTDTGTHADLFGM